MTELHTKDKDVFILNEHGMFDATCFKRIIEEELDDLVLIKSIVQDKRIQNYIDGDEVLNQNNLTLFDDMNVAIVVAHTDEDSEESFIVETDNVDGYVERVEFNQNIPLTQSVKEYILLTSLVRNMVVNFNEETELGIQIGQPTINKTAFMILMDDDKLLQISEELYREYQDADKSVLTDEFVMEYIQEVVKVYENVSENLVMQYLINEQEFWG